MERVVAPATTSNVVVNGGNAATSLISPRESKIKLPKFVEDLIREKERNTTGEAKATFDGSISDLLASQNLKEVFNSFKAHELEFSTYFRPIMQEVLKESGAQKERTDRSWDDFETWTFLQRSICRDNKVCTDMINQH